MAPRGATWWSAAILLTLAVLATRSRSGYALSKMHLAFTWGTVNFKFDSPTQQKSLEEKGTYKQGVSIPFDVDVDPNSKRIFVSMPNMMPGSAVTLATIENLNQTESPRLVPYPDWSWHAGARGCEGLTSVFRMQVDGCGRLWAIDSGITEIARTFTRKCPPQLFVFDLKTNKLIVRHSFKEAKPSCKDTLMLNVVVDQKGNTCNDDAYAYIADPTGSTLYVYHLKSKSSWPVASYLFYPDVNSREFVVAGESVTLIDGVLGLALSPRLPDARCERYLFFHALASRQEGRVCTTALQNRTALAQDAAAGGMGFIGTRSSQAAAQAVSSKGVMFFSPVSELSINCWNYMKPYTKANQPAVEQDRELLRFVAGVKVVGPAGGKQELWVVANNAQLLFSGKWKTNARRSVNVVRGSVDALTAGTPCERRPSRRHAAATAAAAAAVRKA